MRVFEVATATLQTSAKVVRRTHLRWTTQARLALRPNAGPVTHPKFADVCETARVLKKH